ncbi:MAG TPA: nuclear transport factor 2 family protein [Gaiellaceae bacterium]|nr:nuclear transport factor 2 family protein [Gaiellaceae bacterium]
MVSALDHLESADFQEFATALAPDVVWVGLRPGQLCRSRDEVVATFRAALDAGRSGRPEVVAEMEGRIVVDPHVEPLFEEAPELHHVFVVEDERIVEMRDYPNRRAALEAAGL